MAKKSLLPHQDDKKHLKQYQAMRAKLESWVDPKICRLDCFYKTAIFFMFKGFQVIVIPQSNAYKFSATSKSAKVFFDQDFQMIRTVLSGKKLKKDYDNGSYIIEGLMQAIKKGLTNSEAEKAMAGVHDYIIKKSLQEHYKLSENPDNEYFLYGDDELEPRYRGYQPPMTLPDGVPVKVRIKDSSALLITDKSGQRFIDLDTGMNYSDDKFIYIGNLTQRKECSAKAKYKFVSYNSKTGKKTYYKNVLKKGVNLAKHEDKLAYVLADGMQLDLYFDATSKTFCFKDEQGVIKIAHPDLLIYFES